MKLHLAYCLFICIVHSAIADVNVTINNGGDMRTPQPQQIKAASDQPTPPPIIIKQDTIKCPKCKGEGLIKQWQTCASCNGSGFVYDGGVKKSYTWRKTKYRQTKTRCGACMNSVAGVGKVKVEVPCPRCNGSGVIIKADAAKTTPKTLTPK